jgi:deoxyadenosine/deoxycytidine kinase
MIRFVTPPDLLIYLRADIPKLVGNIQRRGRVYEEKIRLDYLRNLNKFYEAWISTYQQGKLLTINMNDLNFIDNVDDFAFIVEKVDVEINGLFSG